MERPTCETCIHFESTGGGTWNDMDGYCLRLPKQAVVIESKVKFIQSEMNYGDSCAEHPDFPAYLEARKAEA